MEKKIVDYILEDIGCIIKNGLDEDEEGFIITKAIANYLIKNSLQPCALNGIIYDALINEYIDYIQK